MTVADEAMEASAHIAYRVVWAETAPLEPIQGEPGFAPKAPPPEGSL